MSHTVAIKVIADSKISFNSKEIDIHDISAIELDGNCNVIDIIIKPFFNYRISIASGEDPEFDSIEELNKYLGENLIHIDVMFSIYETVRRGSKSKMRMCGVKEYLNYGLAALKGINE